MKTLINCIRLSCSVKIYVPSTVNVNEHIDTQQYVDTTLSFLSSLFGGSTASKALGAWINTVDGSLVKENVTLVLSYATQEQLEKGIDAVYEYCLSLKEELKQQAISLEVNNELYLI